MIKNLKSKKLRELLVDVDVLNCGALSFLTGRHTGRSPDAKSYEDCGSPGIDWDKNNKISSKEFDKFLKKFINFADRNYDKIHLQEVFAVRDPKIRMKVNIYTEFARHALFSRNMFIPNDEAENTEEAFGEYDVYHFPSLLGAPSVLISIKRKIILISGTMYSGEIKKSVFSVLNYHFPDRGWLPMHCSVNVDKNRENPAIFFGLSGTGKTTLSSDEKRILIGDDEHGWTDNGLTNFENGCYAKTINLSKKDEPQIWSASQKEFSILENVVVRNGEADFSDGSITENTRSSYPAKYIDDADSLGYVNLHPKNIIMLTCDAFGVLPAVMKLSADEAIDQFLMGYTAKVAGTESGVREPVATFSFCFGAPFMPLKPKVYADILRNKVRENNVDCWLINTGWTGGEYGVGSRMPIGVTRSIIDKIHNGSLAKCEFVMHKYTKFSTPKCKDIEDVYLQPELGWDNLSKYKNKCKELLFMFYNEKQKYI